MTLVKREIGEILVDNGQITPEELERAQDESTKTGMPLSKALSSLGLIDEGQLKSALELEYGVNYVALKKTKPDPDAIALVPRSMCVKLEAIPVSKDAKKVTLAMVTPSDQDAIDEFHSKIGLQIKPLVCLEEDFAEFVKQAYGEETEEEKADKEKEKADKKEEKADKEDEKAHKKEESSEKTTKTREEAVVKAKPTTEVGATTTKETDQYDTQKTQRPTESMDAPSGDPEDMAIILLSNHIISNAISRGCTNIHIEPTEKQVLVHYRKDGVLFAARKLPRALLPDLVRRFKSMTEEHEGERSLPYDARLNVQLSGSSMAFRLSIVHGAYGEHLVIWLD